MENRLKRKKRQKRIRAKISGKANCPRVVVFRSNKHLYLQAIDDEARKTVAASSNVNKQDDPAVILAKALKKAGIKKIVFDRAGYKYHGKIKTIAEKLRNEGLEF